MLLVDDYSNVGWVLFLKDRTGSTVTQDFPSTVPSITGVSSGNWP